MTTENSNSEKQVPKRSDFTLWMDYSAACYKVGVTPEPNPKEPVLVDATGKPPVLGSKVLKSSVASFEPSQDSAAPARTVGFDPRIVEPFDGWTAEQIRTVAVFHWDYLPLFSKEKTSWWAENSKGLEFFKRNFHKMAEAVPAKLTLERMEYAVKKATEPPKEYDYDPNCPNGCKGGFIREMQKVGRGHLPVIVRECECRRLVPVGTPMRKKQT